MRMLLISPFPPLKIADADHACRIASHLADSGVDVHVLTQVGGVAPDHPRLQVYPWMENWSWRELPRLIRCLRKAAPEAVLLNFAGHLYHWHPMMTFAASVSRVVAPKAAFVTQIEYPGGASVGPNAGWKSRLIHKAVRLALGRGADYQFGTLLRDSRRVVILSEAQLPPLRGSYTDVDAKSVLIPPPVLLKMAPATESVRQEQRQRLGVGQDEILLAYFGYIYRNKGIETLLAALKRLSSNIRIRLMLVGGTVEKSSDPSFGYAEQMRIMAQDMGIGDRVMFTGGFDWDSDEASRYLRAADIAVLPFDLGVHMNNSSFAGAAAHGLPIITTKGPDLEEQFIHGQNVILCSPKAPIQLADAIMQLVEQPELRQRLSDGAAEIAKDWFAWEKTVDKLISSFGWEKKDEALSPANDILIASTSYTRTSNL